MATHIITTRCPICGESTIHTLTDDQFRRLVAWKNREGLVQDLLYDFSADQREQFMTGICPDCWNKMFGGPDTEDELVEEAD